MNLFFSKSSDPNNEDVSTEDFPQYLVIRSFTLSVHNIYEKESVSRDYFLPNVLVIQERQDPFNWSMTPYSSLFILRTLCESCDLVYIYSTKE